MKGLKIDVYVKLTDYVLILYEVIVFSAVAIVEPFRPIPPHFHLPHLNELIWVGGIYVGFNMLRIIQESHPLPWLPPRYQSIEDWILSHARQVNPYIRLAYRVLLIP